MDRVASILSHLGVVLNQQIDEKLGLLAARFLLEAEKLFELIYQDAKMPTIEAFQRSGDRGNRRPTATELADHAADAAGILAVAAKTRKFLGQIPQWAACRPHGASLPRHAGQSMLALKLRQHTGAHQRGFSGPG